MLGDIEGGTRRHSVNCGMTPRVFEYMFSRIQKVFLPLSLKRFAPYFSIEILHYLYTPELYTFTGHAIL